MKTEGKTQDDNPRDTPNDNWVIWVVSWMLSCYQWDCHVTLVVILDDTH
jgi:hypothetical protein